MKTTSASSCLLSSEHSYSLQTLPTPNCPQFRPHLIQTTLLQVAALPAVSIFVSSFSKSPAPPASVPVNNCAFCFIPGIVSNSFLQPDSLTSCCGAVCLPQVLCACHLLMTHLRLGSLQRHPSFLLHQVHHWHTRTSQTRKQLNSSQPPSLLHPLTIEHRTALYSKCYFLPYFFAEQRQCVLKHR